MVIRKSAVTAFRNKPLRDMRKAKRFSDRVLDLKIEREDLVLHTKPRRAQKVCLLVGMAYDRVQYLLGLGAGKTKLTLDLFVNRVARGEASRCLVLVPNVVNLSAWVQEVAKHAPHMRIAPVYGGQGPAKRQAIFEDESYDIIVSTYAGFVERISKRRVLKPGEPKKKTKVKESDLKACKAMGRLFDFAIFDETTAYSNPDSLTFRALRHFLKTVRFCYGLTGTPFDRNVERLWAQLNMIDGGASLGETLGMYRALFFREEQPPFGPSRWVFNKTQAEELADRLAHSCVRYAEHEVQDLPPVLGGMRGGYMIRSCPLPPANFKYYDRLVRQLEEESKKQSEEDGKKRRKQGYLQLRMVSSGWVGAGGKEDRIELIFPKNPKLELLMELLLQEIPEDEKVIVFAHFKTTARKIIQPRLKKAKVSHVLIDGSVTGAEKKKRMAQVQSPGGPRVLLATSAIRMGLNLQDDFSFMIFFESSDDAEVRAQMEGRIDREGKHRKTRHIYDLACDDTVDFDILDANLAGKRNMNHVLDGVSMRKKLPGTVEHRGA